MEVFISHTILESASKSSYWKIILLVCTTSQQKIKCFQITDYKTENKTVCKNNLYTPSKGFSQYQQYILIIIAAL